MSEKAPDRKEVIFPEIPDEIFTVDGYGARVTVNVWHSPVPKIKPVFKAKGGSVPDESSGDTREIREQKYDSLTTMARLVGYQALLQRIPILKTNLSVEAEEPYAATTDLSSDASEKSFYSIITPTLDEIETPTADATVTEIEENHEPLLIESLKPGDIIPINDVSELALFESQLATEIQPNGIQGLEEKWSTREPLKDLIKKFSLNGAKFNGTVTDVQLEVMPNPAGKLLEANESKQEAKFIFSEKLPYKPSAIRIAAIQSGTIGFTATIGFKSTKGLHGTVQSEIWYSRMSSRSIKDVNRYMTRPVVVECFEANNETVRLGAVPIKRRSLMSEAFQSKLSRRATLR